MPAGYQEVEEDLAATVWRKSGEHILEVGPTGTGKTNGLYLVVDKLLKYNPAEKLVWFDTGKSAEIAGLALFRRLMIHIPAGCKISIEELPNRPFETKGYEVREFKTWRELWKNIKETPLTYINVVSFEPFVSGGTAYVSALNGLFNSERYSGGLIDLVKRYEIEGPICIILDELNSIAPSKNNELTPGHYASGAKLQFSVQRFRSDGIRLAAATQTWSGTRYGVRSAFQRVMPRQGARFTRDDALSNYNRMWNNLKPDMTVIADRRRKWYAVLKLPFYCDGSKIWRVRYYGQLRIGKALLHQDKELVSREVGDVIPDSVEDGIA